MKHFQIEVNLWASQFKEPYFPVFEQLTHLMEEVGELGREISHKYGVKKKKDSEKKGSIKGEIGDALFTIICIGNKLGIDLDEAIIEALQKAKVRDNDRFKK